VVNLRSGLSHATAYALIDFDTSERSCADMMLISRSWNGDASIDGASNDIVDGGGDGGSGGCGN
jgi:hypothetical protein